jgi:hypothetical protein
MVAWAGVWGALYLQKLKPLSPRAMPPITAIAKSERPLFCPSAARGLLHSGWVGKCYESFTLNALLFAGVLRTFALVMTGRKSTSRTATAGVFRLPARAQTTISAAMSFSACNLLFLTPTSDFRTLPTEN